MTLSTLSRNLEEVTGRSQETPQLAVGMNGKRWFERNSPYYGIFLGRYPTVVKKLPVSSCMNCLGNGWIAAGFFKWEGFLTQG